MVEPHLELNVEISPSPSSTAWSLIDAFDLNEASDHLRVNPVDEGVSNSGCIHTTSEGLVAASQAESTANRADGGFGEGRPVDVQDSSTPPSFGRNVSKAPLAHTLPSPGKSVIGAIGSSRVTVASVGVRVALL